MAVQSSLGPVLMSGMPLAGRTGTEVRPMGQSVLSWLCITKDHFIITRDTFSRHFGKSSLEYSQKKAKRKSFRGLLESVEFGVVSVPSLLFPALSHSPSSLPLSWQWQRATQMAESFCWDCHHLLACFVLLSTFKGRTTLQSSFWNL